MNELAGSTSPYLRQHADNPVHWREWDEAALARAREEDKPILLSVGYSTCHWCHVMAHESFEDEEVAAAINRDFVPIKIDREERPDLDALAMDYVLATRGQGGWPLTLVLTPAGEPVFGGTYFPPRDGPRGTGLLTILAELSRLWREQRQRVVESGEEARRRLDEHHEQLRAQARGEVPGEECFARALNQLEDSWDRERGGFGNAPKFPRPSVLLALVRLAWRADRAGEEEAAGAARAMIGSQLGAMSRGGLRDHLGGGFHRYTVDGNWRIPHYEKMLYDQAQLVLAWTEAAQLGGVVDFAAAREVVAETIDFVERELGAADGCFHSALDADSMPETGGAAREGAFYVWTSVELAEVLEPEQLALFAAAYGCEADGNAPVGTDPHGELAGTNTLWRACDDAELATNFGLEADEVERRLAAARSTLAERRTRRPRPHRDDKIIAAWNGLMIAALARAGQVFGEPAWIGRAVAAWEGVTRLLGGGTGEFRRSGIDGRAGAAPAQAGDYACLVWGMLELAEASLEPVWVERAAELQDALDGICWDERRGLYLSVDPRRLDHPAWALAEDEDGAEPAANSVAGRNLLRLALLCDRDDWRQRARTILEASAGILRGGGGLHQPLRLVVLADFLDQLGTDSFVGAVDEDLERRRRVTLEPLQVLVPPQLAAGALPDGVGSPAILRCRPGRCELID